MGGRGWPLVERRDEAQPTNQQSVEVKVTADWGKPVRGKQGVVGWMRDHGAVSKKVSEIILDRLLL